MIGLGRTRLDRSDWGVLALFAGGLFGGGMLLGGPLTESEWRLSESAQVMCRSGEWLVPRYQGGPWLESAPLAQWLTAGSWKVLGGDDRLWPLRLPAVLASLLTVLIVAQLAARWFGRVAGLMSGLILATSATFAGQAWRATSIPLLTCLCTATWALFTWVERERDDGSTRAGRLWPEWLAGRSWRLWLAFGLLGATNLSGPLWLGPVCVLIPILGFLFWNWDAPRVSRYAWLWGWLFATVIAFAWPCCVARQIPEAWDFWAFDWTMRWLGGELVAGAALLKPLWYYGAALPWLLVPWSLVIPAGVWMTRHEALAERYSPQRWLWCWAGLWPLAASLMPGKSPLWLLPVIPAWSVLAALGLLWLRDRVIEWPAWAKRPWPLSAVLVGPLLLWLLICQSAGGRVRETPVWLSVCPLAAAVCVWQWRRTDFGQAARTIFASVAAVYLIGFWEFGQRVDSPHHPEVAAQARSDRSLVASSPIQTKYGDSGSMAEARLGRAAMNSVEVQGAERLSERAGTKIELAPRWR